MKTNVRLWKALAVLLALAGTVALAVRFLTIFGFWDDEGYLLVNLRHYVDQGHLYTQTASQYGPFYFYAQGLFFQLLHLPITHDMGRLVTLLYWLASGGLAALFVHRLSKSLFLTTAGGFCCLLVGSSLTNEPDHPQQVLLLLYMLAACLGQLSLPAGSARYGVRLFLLGCVGAALAFTKVNVGIFFVAGLAQALFCLLPSGKIRWLGIGLTMLYAAGVPWFLMHAGFADGFRGYCVVATASAVVALTFGALLKPDTPLPGRSVLYAAAGLLVGSSLIVAATLLQGVSPLSLLAGVIINPMHHPKVFDLVLYIGRNELLPLLILVAGVVVVRVYGNRLAESRPIDLLRCVVGMAAILLLTLPANATLVFTPLLADPLKVLVDTSAHRIQWVAPLLPLPLIPQASWNRNAAALFPRLFITFMAVTQFLEAYPVAGSQVGIAAAPMVLWAFLCIHDGIIGLRSHTQTEALTGGAILVVLAGLTITLSLHSQFPPATKLQGSSWLHLPLQQTAEYEPIVKDVTANCDMLFTMPGMGSFNVWSGVPTPNGWNLTAWMKGFSNEQQAGILRILQSDPQSCAIVNHRIVRFWDTDEAAVAALPLAQYLTTQMPKVAQFGDYEIHVHPERQSPWLGTPSLH